MSEKKEAVLAHAGAHKIAEAVAIEARRIAAVAEAAAIEARKLAETATAIAIEAQKVADAAAGRIAESGMDIAESNSACRSGTRGERPRCSGGARLRHQVVPER